MPPPPLLVEWSVYKTILQGGRQAAQTQKYRAEHQEGPRSWLPRAPPPTLEGCARYPFTTIQPPYSKNGNKVHLHVVQVHPGHLVGTPTLAQG